MRIADSFVSRHHPDSFIKFRGNKKDNDLFRDLPESVLTFLGKPMSKQSILELSKTDNLEIIYNDNVLPDREKIQTRSMNQRKQKLLDEMTDQIYNAEDSDTEEDVPLEKNIRRKVRFVDLPSDPRTE